MERAARIALAVVVGLGFFAAGFAVMEIVTSRDDAVVASPSPSASPSTAPSPSATASATVTPSPAPTPTATAEPLTSDVPVLSIDDPASPWVVVNKTRPVNPEDFEPDDLVALSGTPGGSGHQARAEVAEKLEAMADAAEKEDAPFRVSTAYRSSNVQAGLFNDYVNTWGVERAETFSARPGYSEHQTGLAVDLYDNEECHLKACFADRPAGQWLAAHAHEYGFIIRYLDGADAVTGYRYEPWHVRYVGLDLAAELVESGQTMEEHFDLPAAPDYLD